MGADSEQSKSHLPRKGKDEPPGGPGPRFWSPSAPSPLRGFWPLPASTPRRASPPDLLCCPLWALVRRQERNVRHVSAESDIRQVWMKRCS
jgi:hypothetical protein